MGMGSEGNYIRKKKTSWDIFLREEMSEWGRRVMGIGVSWEFYI